MRSPRIITIACAFSAGIAISFIGATIPAIPANAATTTVHYVALGDSYASGEGAGSTSGLCVRGPNAYGRLWAAANSPASFAFPACSGATTSSVINSQLSSLSSATTLVSITVGGDDAGFVPVMATCVLGSTATCESAVSRSETYIKDTLPGDLTTMLADIRSDAPSAKVIVLGYPDFYDTSVSGCSALSSGDRSSLDAGINDLDGALQTAAASSGDTFVDVRSEFSGHEFCDSSAWLNPLSLLNIEASFHPTATGQQDGYLPAFTAAATAVGQ